MLKKLLALLAVVGLATKLRKGGPDERILIDTPAELSAVASPVTVGGAGQASQHNQLAVRVRDEAGNEIGAGTVSISGGLGARGTFTGSVTYTGAVAGQRGRIEVYDTSPRDGQVVHLSSVDVILG